MNHINDILRQLVSDIPEPASHLARVSFAELELAAGVSDEDFNARYRPDRVASEAKNHAQR